MQKDRDRKLVKSGKWRAESREGTVQTQHAEHSRSVRLNIIVPSINMFRGLFSPRNLLYRCIAIIITVLMLAVVSFAQNAAPEIKAAEKANLYDLDASGTELRFVLEALARRAGTNIVVSPGISGAVTAQLKQVSIDSILEFLSKAQGFDWEKNGDTYLVTAKNTTPKLVEAVSAPPEPMTMIWNCHHVDASSLAVMISKIYPNMKATEGPTSGSPELESGSGMGGDSSGGSSGSGSSDKKKYATKLVLVGDPGEIGKVKSLLEQLDIKLPQISIEVAIAELSTNNSNELGVTWEWSDMLLKEKAPTSGINFGKISKTDGMSFTATISAMIKDGTANLLAKPNISVIDNQYAEILIGDRILFPKLAGYTANGAPYYDKAEERVGIYLQIAARVSDKDEVTLTIAPQVSLVTDYLKTAVGDYPQISTRQARTTLSCKNGATVAIGGLMREDEIRNASKVPLLGDLPIIGSLFRHEKKTKIRTELVIFLTPKIVEESI